ncbi:MAG: LTA synthase family protein [Chitinophagales bacterium]
MGFLKMLVKRILLLMGFFQLSRLLFLAFNFSLFPHLTPAGYLHILWGSFRFDISTIVYVNVLYIFLFLLPFNFRFNKAYQTFAKLIFITGAAVCLFADIADMAYYPFLLHRTNAAFFLEFKHDTNLLTDAGKFVWSYWYLAFLFAGLLWLLIRSYNWIKMPVAEEYNRKKLWLDAAAIPFVALLWLGFARGSFVPSNRPLNLSYAGFYVRSPEEANLVVNTPFSIMTTFGNIKVHEATYYTSFEEAAKYYQPIQSYAHEPGTEKRKNVVIIIVESLSREFVGGLNEKKDGYEGYTPFLDSLLKQSMTFKYSYANGRRSIEALPTVVASIPSFTEAYTLTPYTTNTVNSLPLVLKRYGYNTSFFHGAHEGSMGFAAFMTIAGVDKNYSKNEYGNEKDFDGTWGIYDEEFLQYWAQQMNTFKEPFYSSVFTVSSHHPFALPERYKNSFKAGTLAIHPSVQYTDMAIRRFFETASKMPWYKNTVFVITADHAAALSYYQNYQNPVQSFAVPILFFTPDSSLSGFKNYTIQQADIFPTLVDYLGLNDTILAFGKSALRDTTEGFVVNCYAGIYQAYYKDFALQFDGNKALALYKFKEDTRLQNNLLGQYPDEEKLILAKLKAYIQQYNNRVRNNKMLP